MKIKKGLIFTGKWFTGKCEVLSVNESANELKMLLNDSWQESWNLKHTIQGFKNGDYFKKQINAKHRL